MIKYLLDTNICAFYFRNKYGISDKLAMIGLSKCAISEITLAELKFGIELSNYKEENTEKLSAFTEYVSVIPIRNSISLYAKEKARLKLINKTIDDFDMLIGTTAVANNLIMATDNVKHLSRIENIKIENWTER
jgi:tRNA(fMet)-specific endonuclease VapC